MMKITAAFFGLLLLSACAEKAPVAEYTPTGPYQTINVNTPGVTGANCVVQAGRDSYSVIAPGSLTVRRAPDQMNVACFKGEHMRGQQSVTPMFSSREVQDAEMDKVAFCKSCTYPSTVTVAMALNSGSMQVTVRQFH